MLLKNGQKLSIEAVKIEDAEDLIDYMKLVTSESDNLSMGAADFNMTVEQEVDFIKSLMMLDNSFMLIARIEDVIVGTVSVIGSPRKRVKHHSELGISVKREFWNLGIASELMNEAIEFAKKSQITEVLHLNVRTDNYHAVNLYKKLGFEMIGVFEKFMKIDDVYHDVHMMNLYL